MFVCAHNDGRILIVILYVDDGIVAATDTKDCQNFLDNLMTEFQITAGPVSYFLGIEIKKQKDGSIFITQETYAKRILRKFNMLEATPVGTPTVSVQDPEDSVTKQSITENMPYRTAVGSLMYLATGTRPDLAHAVSIVSQKLDNATIEDWNKVKRIFRHLNGTVEPGILYKHKDRKSVV